MRLRRFAPALGVAGLFLLAAAAAALAADVLRWDRHLERSDLRFAAARGEPDMWTPDTLLPAGVSRALLGAGDDVALRRAVQSVRFSRPRSPVRQFADVTLRSAAEGELARAAQADPEPQHGALLANLRGVLALEEARLAQAQSSVLIRRAVFSFREAIRLDADYEDAKFNLELALRLLQRSGSETGGGGGERAETPASGAGAASGGGGY